MTTLPAPMIPDLLILGAQKCGTTSLAMALGSHPDVFIPGAKEAQHYGFVPDDEVGGESYRRFFRGRRGERLVGEATPEYLHRAASQRQITANLPDVKAIVMLRNPVDRAYSAFNHGIRFGAFGSSFEDALADEPRLVAEGSWGFTPLVSMGRYATQLRRYLDGGLDRSRLHVILFDDLRTDPTSVLGGVQDFLGLDVVVREIPVANQARRSFLPVRVRKRLADNRRRSQIARLAFEASLRSSTPPPMNSETRSRLVETFAGPNEELSVLIGRDLSGWNK